MGRPIFGLPNRLDAAVLSGGSWEAALPLANAQDRALGLVARTTDATTGSTTFDADLGAAYSIRCLALFAHNLSLAATVRVYADDEPTFTSPPYDSTALAAYPTIYASDSTLWGEDVSDDPLSAEEYARGVRHPFVLVLSAAQAYRYWRFAITDTGNADGYVQVGRPWVSGGWQPSANFIEGASLGWENVSTRTRSDGGAAIYDARQMARVADIQFQNLPEDEAMVQAMELTSRVGTTEQVFFCWDTDDTIHMQRRAFLGTLREANPVLFPHHSWLSAAYSIAEEL